MSVQREKIRFSSGDTECADWHYPGGDGACLVMAGGFALSVLRRHAAAPVRAERG